VLNEETSGDIDDHGVLVKTSFSGATEEN